MPGWMVHSASHFACHRGFPDSDSGWGFEQCGQGKIYQGEMIHIRLFSYNGPKIMLAFYALLCRTCITHNQMIARLFEYEFHSSL